MTMESTTFYIMNDKIAGLDNYIKDNSLERHLKLIDRQDIGIKSKQKIKSLHNLMTRKEFTGLVNFLRDNKAEMLNTTMYLNTDGNVRAMQLLDEFYRKEGSKDMVMDSTQFDKIFVHTDLDVEITSFIKNFEGNITLMEKLPGFDSTTFYRVNITGIRVPKGYEHAWNFIQDVGMGAYFKKPN